MIARTRKRHRCDAGARVRRRLWIWCRPSIEHVYTNDLDDEQVVPTERTPPGSAFSYSETNYLLLKLMIERLGSYGLGLYNPAGWYAQGSGTPDSCPATCRGPGACPRRER